jgi:acylphosphatase
MNAASHSAGGRWFRRIIFQGRVQGVGFRYTTASAARAFQINGYVRNCPDGSVELVAEGRAEDVDRLLESLGATFAGNIERQTAEDITLALPPDGFEIRR